MEWIREKIGKFKQRAKEKNGIMDNLGSLTSKEINGFSGKINVLADISIFD